MDNLGLGFRVPLLVISPYAYAGDNAAEPHVTHDTYELSSVLGLAETLYGLPSMGRRDATAGNLMDALDLTTVHNPAIPLTQRVCPKKNIIMSGDFAD